MGAHVCRCDIRIGGPMSAGEWELIVWAEAENTQLARLTVSVSDEIVQPSMPVPSKYCFEGAVRTQVGHLFANDSFKAVVFQRQAVSGVGIDP